MTQAGIRQKLPIGVFLEAFAFPFANFGALFRIFFIPSLLFITIAVAVLWYFAPPGTDLTNPESVEAYLLAASPIADLLNVIFVVFTMMFAVHLHRYIVNEEDPGWVIFRFGRYELMYLLTTIVIMLCIVVVLVAAAAGALLILGLPLDPQVWMTEQPALNVASPPGWVWALAAVLYAVFIWAMIRLVLMLPHAAVTGRVSFSASWRAMKGNFWRFVLAALLFTLLVILVIVLLSGSGYIAVNILTGLTFEPGVQVPPEQVSMLIAILIGAYALVAVVWIFYFAMAVAFISYTYAYLLGNPGRT